MCGITGIVNYQNDEVISESILTKMCSVIKHRGPDEGGVWSHKNVGFARANNQMLKLPRGEYALLLNSDTIVLEDSIPKLIEFMDKNTRVGACGPGLLNGDYTFQRSFMDFPSISYELRYHLIYHFIPFGWIFNGTLDYEKIVENQARLNSATKVSVIPGACFLVRMETYRDVGPMSEDYFLYSEENDWCWRMKQKRWQIYYIPSASIVHLGGQSTEKAGDLTSAYHFYLSRCKFFEKHKPKATRIILKSLHILFFAWLIVIKSIVGALRKSKQRETDERILLYKKLLKAVIV